MPSFCCYMFCLRVCAVSWNLELLTVTLSALFFDDASPLMRLEAHFRRLLFQPLLSCIHKRTKISGAWNFKGIPVTK